MLKKQVWLALLLFFLQSMNVSAQEFPTKLLKLIVPFPPGGANDLVARPLAQRLSIELGQPVVLDNRGGANGIVGAQAVVNSPADGYTLLLAGASVMSVNPVVYARIPYDPLKSFAPVSMLTKQPLLIAVHLSVPAHTLPELFKLARAKPGQLNFAGVGTSTSLPFFYLQSLAGVKIQEIPYAGGGPGLVALLGGQVEVMAFSLGTIYPQVQAKKIRGLAVTSAKRSTLAPELPTVAELGFPGFDASVWTGLAVPAGTPREIIDRLNRATIKAMSAPDMKEQFTKAGIEIVTTTPEKFGEHIRDELARWKKVANEAGIKPQ